MDHIYLSLPDFIWLAWFIVPPAVAGFLFGGPCSRGVLGLAKTALLRRLGFVASKTPASDAERTLVDFLLGSSMIVWGNRVEELPDGTAVATFLVPNATHIHTDGTVSSGDLEVKLELTHKSMISATFAGKALSPHDALALVFNAFAGHTHPLVH
eukprot:2735106-Prymnesium_polylepis.1